MKLVYFEDPHGNFGDDLNPWLWDRLLPGQIDGDEQVLMLGVGTILEPWFVEQLPPTARKVVMGSGAGMTVPPIALDGSWEVVCVRGPLTAAYLGLDYARAATDPAVCIRDFWAKPANPGGRVGFMPHHVSLRSWDWQATCELAGLEYVDPHRDPLETLAQIAGLRLLLTEAMHGAICADALRVPWLALQINPFNYVGKWHDWAASVRLPVHFKPLPCLNNPLLGRSLGDLVKTHGPRMAAYLLRRRSSRRDQAEAVRRLQEYAQHHEPSLSTDDALDSAIDAFRTRLAQWTGR